MFLSSDGVTRFNHGSGTAGVVCTGGLLASGTYEDLGWVPVNGIFSRGEIRAAAIIRSPRFVWDDGQDVPRIYAGSLPPSPEVQAAMREGDLYIRYL
jgi:hypothetical protein